jgi:beta-glucosidase
MNEIKLGPLATDFVWASGIEDTFVPQVRPGHRSLDEYELMGHYEHWREDLALARELGVQALRWGVPWYRVEPQPGEFDWRWTDQVIPYMVEELGITPIIDLMHYGCPFWLSREFVNPEYPRRVAAYAAEFARRYQHLVRWYTPLNEPIVNALMCGRRGHWPPYLRGDKGYIQVMLQLALGITRTVRAIQEVDPEAKMVHVDAVGASRTCDERLRLLMEEERNQNFLAYDLITGRVNYEHPLFSWLVRHGGSSRDLVALVESPVVMDMVGVNFYPQWCTREHYFDPSGRLAQRVVDQEGHGFAEILEAYYLRYGVPLMVTETSAVGSESVRAQWLDTSLAAIKTLRGNGIPVMGYTWFPMFTMIDWMYRRGRRPLADYHLELGLFTLQNDTGSGRWAATSLVERFRQYATHPEEAVGTLESLPLVERLQPAANMQLATA